MKRFTKRTLTITAMLFLAGFFYLDPYNIVYGQRWKFTTTQSAKDLPWVDFLWDGTTIAGRHHDKAAMLLKVKLDGIASNFYCQFDMGAIYTMVYENTLQPYLSYSPALKNKQGSHMWHKTMNNLTFQIGGLSLQGDRVLVFKHYGEIIPKDSIFSDEPKMIGTIGVDVCQDKIVIIDYPNTRICFLDSMPPQYHATNDMKVTGSGRPFLRMKHKGKEYNLFYDTGSSIFPLWVSKSMVTDFSPYPVNDTIVASSWGKYMTVYGRPMTDTITVGSKSFSDFEVFNNGMIANKFLTKMAIDILGFGGLTGNALFYNSIVILDFKNKKFEIM